ncbi:glycoside hydrolase family 16 protein [Arthrobacter sp. Leaf141]|uniref:glycoside hydrolase family 16 protein n=1 Tax=Arthrobacter sp. Leaf141 TaxID=1736273 RepID=UPI001F197E3F|nr:glycoside hydrolase family 16 protein [Arthrobacter sp. Leaf141]
MSRSSSPVSSRLRRTRTAAMIFTAALAMMATIPPANAADTTPMDPNPGPAGSFSWKGFNWEKRFWGGSPQFNGQFAAANVVNPDANGYISMKLTNPTGTAPVASEFQSTRKGFGYGTYSTTVEKDLSILQKEVVWGCLFTYDPDAEPGYNEIDLCEASAWGGGASYGESWPVTQGHGYWFDATKPPGQGNNTVTFGVTSSSITTHRMVWEPGRITFETFAGTGYTGALLKRTVLEGSTVPVPAQEQVHFNLWVTGGGGGNPAAVKAETVKIRDFSFVAAPAPSISLRAATSTYTGGYTTNSMKWTGAQGDTVTLWMNNIQKVVPNTGSFPHRYKGTADYAYKVCDANGCSNVVNP